MTVKLNSADLLKNIRERRKPKNNLKVIHVFDTDLRGRHATSSGRMAVRYHGAVRGRASGLQGNSWGIPVKGYEDDLLSIHHVVDFLNEVVLFSEKTDLFFHVHPLALNTSLFTKIALHLMQSPECFYLDKKIVTELTCLIHPISSSHPTREKGRAFE